MPPECYLLHKVVRRKQNSRNYISGLVGVLKTDEKGERKRCRLEIDFIVTAIEVLGRAIAELHFSSTKKIYFNLRGNLTFEHANNYQDQNMVNVRMLLKVAAICCLTSCSINTGKVDVSKPIVLGVERLDEYLPVVHGMTLGELAVMIDGEGWLEDVGQFELQRKKYLRYKE